MFDDELAGALGDRRALADLAATIEHDQRIAGCRKLVLAAAWADAHSEVDHPDGGLLVERLLPLGPVGCPPVAEFAPQGLVGPYATSTQSARAWITDALTIRHRLPRLWERVVAGEIQHWKARQIATLTAHLSVLVAGQVDEQTSPWLTQLPWQTFLRALDATMLEIDETSYRERERLAAAKREVRATQSHDGLRTLIARGEAGDVAMMLALHQRVADCLADDGDEDPLPVRMSKAIGIIAHPARLTDLLLRHATDPEPHRQPWEQTAAHHTDPTDPWADDLPPAGWQTSRHGNYHQPTLDDDDWWDLPRPDHTEHEDWPTDPPPDPQDLAWYHQETDSADHDQTGMDGDHQTDSDHVAAGRSDVDADRPATKRDGHVSATDADDHDAGDLSSDEPTSHPAIDATADGGLRDGDGESEGHVGIGDRDVACRCGAGTDGRPVSAPWPEASYQPRWRPLTPTEIATCAPTVVMHVHLSDQTLRDNHGVVRTDAGPILLEQLKRYLVSHDATIKVYPVIDPAATASADSYEIPLRLRRTMAIRHPRSVFPHSPTSRRLDLDHTPAYVNDGPPGQTGMHSLGPLARNEHRAKTVGHWQSRQPEPGTYLWRSPEDWIAITTNQGTLVLGHTPPGPPSSGTPPPDLPPPYSWASTCRALRHLLGPIPAQSPAPRPPSRSAGLNSSRRITAGTGTSGCRRRSART